MGTTGIPDCGICDVAVAGTEATVNGFNTRDAACEVSTFDGAPVHLNAGRAGCALLDALGEVIASIAPNTTALAAVPNAPAVAIDCRNVTTLTAEPGVCTPARGLVDAASG